MAEKINNTYFFRKQSGGGGGSSNAVQYTAQTLTDTQKMQARANQGLYYSETVPEQTVVTWDGDTTGLDYFNPSIS